MATITKREVAERVAKQTDQPQLVVKQIIQALFDEIINEGVKGNRLEFRDFGVFEVVTRRPRTGRNPRTGDPVAVEAKRVVTFKAGKLMKERVAAVPPDGVPSAGEPQPEAARGGDPPPAEPSPSSALAPQET